MGDRIVWKEAKSHRRKRDEEEEGKEEEEEESVTQSNICDVDETSARQTGLDVDAGWSSESPSQQSDMESDDGEEGSRVRITGESSSKYVQSNRGFSHNQINLSFRRNITKLADPAQHQPKPDYVAGGQGLLSFDQWIEGALVAISPTADIILFSSQSPEKIVFVAKLRMEPVNQYTTKVLDISLDYDEQVTTLLCLPIMSTQRTSLGLVDWTALVVGLSSGYVKFYTEQSICLLSLKFCDEPVVSIKLQTQKVNTNARSQTHFASIVDELFIAYRSCAIFIDGIGLYENLRISKEDVVKNKSNYEPAYNITNLPTILTCQKWKFEDSLIRDADVLGMRCSTRFDALKSNSINYDHVPSKSFTRTLVTVGRDPFLSCYREAKETVSHSYTEMIGSLLPFWSKPQPSRVQINEVACSSGLSMFDKGRLATNLITSPDKRLAAVTDDFGRVMLVDVNNWLVTRMWKGYRHAQCGWVEVKRDPEEPGTPHASFLVIYAPKRGLLEVWSAQRGPRVAAFNVGKNCRLLYAGHKMLNMRAEATNKPREGMNLLTEQSYDSNCYLLNAKSETLFAIELPYTYSLYKYGDIKSRDRLLITELSAAIQRDAEITALSEIILRMTLAESLQVSIHKLALNLLPDKIVPILEDLIIKIMKEYDNYAGQTMSADDESIVELCKRVIRLCAMFNELCKSGSSDISLPEVNKRLIEQYEEHPQEVDDFAEKLGWEAGEVLRYLSLIALERSFSDEPAQNPWPNMGEPLTWAEFVGCFDLERIHTQPKKRTPTPSSSSAHRSIGDRLSIKLKSFSSKFLKEDRIVKTSIFMYNGLSERFYRLSANSAEQRLGELKEFNKCFSHLEPTTRLILLFQFWLSTRLCNHWKMWAFLQQQVGMVSDELRVDAMTTDDNEPLVESWKRIYHLILESDNIFAAIIATASIRSDTLRMISDNEKREKLEREGLQGANQGDDADGPEASEQALQSIDWECLCVDAERMSIFAQQLEDVFLLGLLLRYSPSDGKLVDKFVYRVPRISVANILRAGPTVISELIAQWVAQTGLNPRVFTQPYGSDDDADQPTVKLSLDAARERPRLLALKFSSHSDSDEHTNELLHHVKTSFPHSLDADVLLLNCLWEFCKRWVGIQTAAEKAQHLEQAYSCLSLLSNSTLRLNSASWAYKAFFQRTFERLTILIETNPTILSPKCLRSRDTLSRRELNMGESHLEDFVSFCFKLSDFMLNTCRKDADPNNGQQQPEADDEDYLKLQQRLMAIDEWWSTPSMVRMLNSRSDQQTTELDHIAALDDSLNSTTASASGEHEIMINSENRNSLVSASLSSTKLFDMDTLIELNRLATLMLIIFKLRIIKTYPLSIIGEESRQTLKLDLQQSPATGSDMKTRSGLLNELRHKFARKCVVSIVAKITEETNEFSDCHGADFEARHNESNLAGNNRDGEAVDTDDNDENWAAGPPKAVGRGGSGGSGGNVSSKDQHRMSGQNTSDQRHKRTTSGFEQAGAELATSAAMSQQALVDTMQAEHGESMALFTHLLSLACEWQLDSDELHLELVFELYRCNHDKLAAQVTNRTRDKQTLANGLLKIASQRVLLLFGLSPHFSSTNQWSKRVDKWSSFKPNVASWLKSIQEEEARNELGRLGFSETLQQGQGSLSKARKAPGRRHEDALEIDYEHEEQEDLNSPAHADFDFYLEQSLGLRLPVLESLCARTKLVLETVTNYLDGQANRLAYDLLQLLESEALASFRANEKRLWLRRRERSSAD